jgi:hypothetical protein
MSGLIYGEQKNARGVGLGAKSLTPAEIEQPFLFGWTA